MKLGAAPVVLSWGRSGAPQTARYARRCASLAVQRRAGARSVEPRSLAAVETQIAGADLSRDVERLGAVGRAEEAVDDPVPALRASAGANCVRSGGEGLYGTVVEQDHRQRDSARPTLHHHVAGRLAARGRLHRAHHPCRNRVGREHAFFTTKCTVEGRARGASQDHWPPPAGGGESARASAVKIQGAPTSSRVGRVVDPPLAGQGLGADTRKSRPSGQAASAIAASAAGPRAPRISARARRAVRASGGRDAASHASAHPASATPERVEPERLARDRHQVERRWAYHYRLAPRPGQGRGGQETGAPPPRARATVPSGSAATPRPGSRWAPRNT